MTTTSTTTPDAGHRCGSEIPMEEGVPADIAPLTDAQRDVIKSTAPILAVHGETITRHFYKNMLLAHPELQEVFSKSAQDTGHQAKVLAMSVHAYAENIHDLTPLLPVVERIAHKHASLHITPNQYAIVARHLIQAIVDILGDAVTPEIGGAWVSGYWNLAKIFIDTEAAIYAEGRAKGGWDGFKEFTVARKEEATDEISHFYLEPVDQSPLPKSRPGEYISVMTYVKSLGRKQARQYSISDVYNSEYIRVSVRRDDADTSCPGLVSNALHRLTAGDRVEISSPKGDFHLTPTDDGQSPSVLLSAGIGQTPLFPILKSCLLTNPARPVTYATVIRDNRANAFKKELRAMQGQDLPGFDYRVFHSRALESEHRDIDYHFAGRMSLARIQPSLHLGSEATQYYLCGPPGFILNIVGQLKDLGVPDSKIHYELFTSGSPS